MSATALLLLWLTMGTLLVGILTAWVRYRSALHPMIILGSLLFYGYGIGPALLFQHGGLDQYFPESWQLEYVHLLNFLGVLCFTIGAMHNQKPMNLLYRGMPTVQVPASARPRLLQLALVLGILGSVAYWQSLQNVGGFTEAYNSAKGGGYSKSGYVGEAPLLLYPAIMILGLAARRDRGGVPISLIILGLLFALPQLLHGTFGGRRGPLFLVLSTMLLAWFTARQKRPSVPVVVASFAIILATVVTVWTLRHTWYIGSEEKTAITQEGLIETLVPTSDPAGHYHVYAAGMVLNVKYHNAFYWGKRYFVTLFIRPIPHQLWPTKYEDTLGPENPWDEVQAWKESVGWIPLAGSASGFIADAYLELQWGCLAICYLMGRFSSWTWRNSIVNGGIWTVLFMQICILGVYLPTQSLSAFWHRFLFMGIPTWFIWKYYVMRRPPSSTSQQKPQKRRTER